MRSSPPRGDYLTLLLFCLLATSSVLAMELYAAFAPAAATAGSGRCGHGSTVTGIRQIIAGSLVVGFWLVANSIYLIVS